MRLAMVKVFTALPRGVEALAFRVAYALRRRAHRGARARRWRRGRRVGEHRRLLRGARRLLRRVRPPRGGVRAWAARASRRGRAPLREGVLRGALERQALHAHLRVAAYARGYALRQLRNREVANAWRRWGEYVSQAHQLHLERRTAARWPRRLLVAVAAGVAHRRRPPPLRPLQRVLGQSRKYHSKAFGRWRWGTATARRAPRARALLSVCRCALRKMRLLAVQEAFSAARARRILPPRSTGRRKAHGGTDGGGRTPRDDGQVPRGDALPQGVRALAARRVGRRVRRVLCQAWKQTLEAKAMRSWRAAADAATADRAAQGGRRRPALKTLRSAFEAWGEARRAARSTTTTTAPSAGRRAVCLPLAARGAVAAAVARVGARRNAARRARPPRVQRAPQLLRVQPPPTRGYGRRRRPSPRRRLPAVGPRHRRRRPAAPRACRRRPRTRRRRRRAPRGASRRRHALRRRARAAARACRYGAMAAAPAAANAYAARRRAGDRLLPHGGSRRPPRATRSASTRSRRRRSTASSSGPRRRSRSGAGGVAGENLSRTAHFRFTFTAPLCTTTQFSVRGCDTSLSSTMPRNAPPMGALLPCVDGAGTLLARSSDSGSGARSSRSSVTRKPATAANAALREEVQQRSRPSRLCSSLCWRRCRQGSPALAAVRRRRPRRRGSGRRGAAIQSVCRGHASRRRGRSLGGAPLPRLR